jgi:hypothetical protein
VITVKEHGWAVVRQIVFERDGGCVAAQSRYFGEDTAGDLCRDQYGDIIPSHALALMEADHVTKNGVRIDAVEFLITVCPWHHRLSQVWRSDSKDHRQAERRWLARRYPEDWNAAA